MTGVILINFGGPRSEDEIRPFLTDIFKEVLTFPLKPFAPLLARIREMRSKKMYAEIGGSSPVVGWTRCQAVLLRKCLGPEYLVYTGMKYGQPKIEAAIQEAKEDGCSQIIMLPLFPYQSKYTSVSLRAAHGGKAIPREQLNTGACFVANAPRNDMRIYNHSLYISAMISIINKSLANWKNIPLQDINFLFSAHALPKLSSKKPLYLKQINESILEIMKSFAGYKWQLAFQSAPFKPGWTGPDVKTVMSSLRKQGSCACKLDSRLRENDNASPAKLLIIPLGFACENLETLYEIDKVYIPYAQKLGFTASRTPALNDNPQFIDLLAKLVLENPQI